MTLVFLHVPKTGGTSFNQALRDQYGAAFHRVKPGGGWRKESVLPPKIVAVSGHMPWGVHKKWGVEATYVTILREPVYRVISLWWFCRKWQKHKWHSAARRLGVVEFCESRRFADLDNGMTRWLAGRGDVGRFPPNRAADEVDLKRAKAHLQQMYAVMFTETLQADVRRLGTRLGWAQVPELPRKMVGKDRPLVSEEDRLELLVLNDLDAELYAWATEEL